MKWKMLIMVPVLILAGHAVALADGAVELQSLAEIETVVEHDDGSVTVQREPASKVVPGDEVFYTMRYLNGGADAAEDVVITNPIPEQMMLMRTGALAPGQRLVFSVDGGHVFDNLAQLRVTDSTGRSRPATAADCTHLRWVFERALEPGETGVVGYVAQLQ
ncbi:MAG: DUF11 domain-containing protein [bacterium]|nr:DUF11 domain-containing protein [bacterium]